MTEREIIVNEKMLGYSDADIEKLLKTKGRKIAITRKNRKDVLFDRTIQFTLEEAIENAKMTIKNTSAQLPDNITLVKWLIRYKNSIKRDCVTKEGNDNWFYPIKTRPEDKDSRWVMKRFIEALLKQGWDFRSDYKVECQTNIEMDKAKKEAAYKASINS